jgi:hypothetical protein
LPWTPPPAIGTYTLTATPFSGSGGSGISGTALTVNFAIAQALAITSVQQLAPGDILLNGIGAVNHSYTVKATSGLMTTPQTLTTISADSGGNFHFEDTNASAQRFYWIASP